LNGEKVFYKTDEDLAREHKEWCDNYKNQQQEEFEKEKDSLETILRSIMLRGLLTVLSMQQIRTISILRGIEAERSRR
jgi:hypothetical protein